MKHKILTFTQEKGEADQDFLRRVEVACDTYRSAGSYVIGCSVSVFSTAVYYLMFASVTVLS